MKKEIKKSNSTGIMLTIVIIIGLMYSLQSIAQVYWLTDQREVKRLQDNIRKLQLENDLLKTDLYMQTSYTQLYKKAIELGFKDSSQEDYYQLSPIRKEVQ